MTENSQITIYQTADGSPQIEVRLEQDTLWLNLLQLAELFGRDKSVISRHLKKIFDTGELAQQALALIRKAARSPEMSAEEGSGLVEIVSPYTQTFLWLQLRHGIQS
ncbi:hypothetical protein NTGBS_820018 [Candidatus Nitrotoga sp. BS]|uniref:hypothetical protein n=1 Tax=Candidatus Nitrotoga sp. BS TaxID=2890408 RepID=UPI001EF34EAF|nr:hypothetical protein [Candidatus Nitrotoga sp. BS]CAH1210103.1 hypothetical protein NTGBS_820018 [Candidatus Nitrotoga sp. BS]